MMSTAETECCAVREHPWAAEWLDSLQRAESTVRSHERNLGQLFRYIRHLGGPAPGDVDFRNLLDIQHNGIFLGKGPVDTAFLAEFLIWHVEGLHDPEAKARKRNDMIYTLRLFFRWCVPRRYLSQDPGGYLEAASVRRKVNHRKHLTPAESQTLLKAAAQSGRHAPRYLAIIATLLLAGLRPGELCALRPSSLSFENGWILADGKTGEGAAPMPPALAKILRSYLASNYFRKRSKGDSGFPLFPKLQSADAISTASLNRLVRRLCLAAGIDRGVTTYWLRHTFATRLYRLGMGFVKVSMALRHGKLKNTYVYVHGREDRMRKIVQESPTGALLTEVYRDVMGLVNSKRPSC